MSDLPAPYQRVEGIPYELVVLPEAREWAEGAAGTGTLHGYASHQPDARALHGRGLSYSVAGPNEMRYVVRHYHRGGAIAHVMHDRYLRATSTRPGRELLASDGARARGVRTPAVVAYAIYPAGIFYRADIVTVEVPRAHDLANELFQTERAAQHRIDACVAAGRLLRDIADKGLLHPDANIKNVLIQSDSHGVRAWILDLDGARVVDKASTAQGARMIARFERSLVKWERKSGRALSPEERRVLFTAAKGED